MKHSISVTRDVLDGEGVLVAQETETIELDSATDDVAVWDHWLSRGAFAIEVSSS